MAPLTVQQQPQQTQQMSDVPEVMPRFSGDGTYMATLDRVVDAAAQRLRVWDTRSGTVKAEFVVGQDGGKAAASPSAVFTCLAWATIEVAASGSGGDAVASKSKKKQRSKSAAESLEIVALGRANGTILLYSLAHGDVWKTLEGTAHNQPTTDIVFAHGGRTAFSSSRDGWVVEWDIANGSVKSSWRADTNGISRLAVNGPSGERLLTAGHDLKVWDLNARTCVKSFTGHGGAVIDLVSSADGRFAASIAEQERCINVWSCEVVGNAGDIALPPTVVLTTESNVTSVAFSQDANLLVACTESGAVNVWREPAVAPYATSTDSVASKKKRQRKAALQSKPCDCDVRVVDAAATGTTIPTIQATFAAATGESGAQLLLAYGGLIRPTFEAVAIEGENEDSEMTILLKSVTLKRTKNTTSVLVDRESVKQMLDTVRKPYHEQASTVIHVVPSMSLEKPRDAMSIDDEEEHSRNATATEQTLQEKLDALKMVDMTIATKSTSASKRAAAPKADSLQQMLVQALRTQDRQLLEECLAVGDARVIQNTVQRLPPSFVLTLLKELVQRFQSRPGRGRALARWIRAMLMFHMSYLMTVPSLADELGALYQMVDERLAHFKKLLRLQGRLDVIDHQVRQRLMATERLSADAQAMATDGSLITRQPLCVYDENEEEEAVADDLDTYDEVTDVEEEWSHLVSGAVDDDFDEDDASIDDEEEDEASTMGDADDAREFLGFDDDEVEA